MHRGSKIRMPADFLSETVKPMQWSDVWNTKAQKKDKQLGVMCPVKTYLKSEGETKFSDMQKQKEFISKIKKRKK